MTRSEAATQRPELKPFAQFLQEARRGGLHTEMSEQLADLVSAVRETGKKGSITLKLTVEPSKDDDAMIVVHDDCKVTLPRITQRPSLFFPDEHGNLHRRDPRQAEIDGLADALARTGAGDADEPAGGEAS